MAADFVADFNSSTESDPFDESEEFPSVSDIVQLLHSKKQRIREIIQTKQREQEALQELNMCNDRYKALQKTYQEIEFALQHALTTNQDDA